MNQLLLIKTSKLISLVSVISGTLLSGNFIIFVFSRQNYLNMDWIKLILLSCAISTPMLLFNYYIIQAKVVEWSDDIEESILTSAGFMTCFILSLPAAICYISGSPLERFLNFLFLGESLLILTFYWIAPRLIKNNKTFG